MMSDQQRDGITPFQTVSPDQIGNWYDGPETFVIAQAKDVQLGAQTYALAQPQAQQEPVAVIGEMFNLFWIGSGPIAPIIERHGLKVGDKLYVGAPTQAPQTKAEIAYRLRWLSKHMIDIAASIDYYGGMAEWAAHGVQMAGAAHIANQWADEIEQEITT